jgi:hypothetical protein
MVHSFSWCSNLTAVITDLDHSEEAMIRNRGIPTYRSPPLQIIIRKPAGLS